MSPSWCAKRSTSETSRSRLARAAIAATCSLVKLAGMPNSTMDPMTAIRRAAVAGSWYPGHASTLASAVDGYLENATSAVKGDLVALVAPHAGLKYSGPVAAHAYRLLRGRQFDVVVLVGPSHFVAFDGVAVVRAGGFETPFGVAQIDADTADSIAAATPVVREQAAAHQREHSIEMQLPFVQRLAPSAGIVPMVM